MGICAEQVLQYITTKSCLGAKDDEGDDEDMEGNQENGEKSKRPEMESETPWVSLASLALFKLFNDWQAQGYQLPPGIFRGGPSSANPNQPATSAKAPPPAAALGGSWSSSSSSGGRGWGKIAASQPPAAATLVKQKKP